MHSFTKLFPSSSFIHVLAIFLTHPDEKFYQAYIAESSGYALIQVQRALKRIEEAGFIHKMKSGNRYYYIANKGHPAFEDIKRALFKTVLFGDLLKEFLARFKSKIQYGFIYGSTAAGNESYDSDIDLFIIGELGIKDIASLLSAIGSELGREINPTIYSLREFKKKIQENNPFIREVLNNKKIWLIGEECEFAKVAQ